MDIKQDINELAKEFQACQKILLAMLNHTKAIMESLPDRSGEE